MSRHMVAADELREEYQRRKAAGELPRRGWMDAVRYLEEISTRRPAPPPEKRP